ncbi:MULTISPECIES: DUF6702 family protein [unclassified Flavobacterium]|uniref:DUF6702 family protein n=1 Tax=unclassified Flavobacterium TaxID=196869 RepID=UPI001290DB85|nr:MULTISPECIES: DUF6702 family protein [unclassified Flavobacterium]MQP51835.1 hypothetical protein [Flavobacterium sp. LMO9]MQP61704.1 hypothetical protein [Flavobacterium sp. LMO6]
MKKYLLQIALPFLLILLLSSFAVHKFYVSVTQIDYVANKKRIEITHRIFIDDLEKALESKYNKKVYLTSSKELPEAEALIKNYLKENIKISINKKPQNIEFLAREVEGDVLIFYTKIAISKKINTFEIFNSLLTDIYKDQQNIVHTNINGNKKSILLTNTELQEKIDY